MFKIINDWLSNKIEALLKKSFSKPEEGTPVFYRKKDIYSEAAEIEANLIAYEMLMPEDKVRKLAEQGLTIEEMADKFFVPESAMTIRLMNLYPDLLIV